MPLLILLVLLLTDQWSLMSTALALLKALLTEFIVFTIVWQIARSIGLDWMMIIHLHDCLHRSICTWNQS